MICYFDLETGGLEMHHPIIQIAAVATNKRFEEVESYEAKIAFDVDDADPKALEMNHYSAEAWRNAKPEARVVAEFAAFCKRHAELLMVSKKGQRYKVARLAGHNATSFDGPRLKAMFARHGAFLPAHPIVICTMDRAIWWAAESGIEMERFRLSECCAAMGITLDHAHDALADVRACVAIARHMAQTAVVCG